MTILVFAAFGGPVAGDDGELQIMDGAATRQFEAAQLAEAYGISEQTALDWYDDRLAVDDLVGEIQGDRADEFGGLYFTKTDGNYILHIQRAEAFQDSRVTIPDGLKALTIAYELVPKTMAELLETRDAVAASVVVTEVGPNPAGGTVDVVAPDEETAAQLRAQFGSAVTITDISPLVTGSANCDDQHDCHPWRGGTSIDRINAGGYQHWCTYGFNVSWNNNGNLKMVTAGHCGNRDYYHAGDLIGSTGANCLPSPGCTTIQGDFQRVANADTYGTPRYCVMGNGTHTCYATSGGTKSKNNIGIGDDIDFRGMTSGYHSPVNINDIKDVVWINGTESGYTEVFTTNDVDQPGDSGGPATWSNKALGIDSANGWFSYMSNAEVGLNVTLCTTSGC